MTQKVLSEVLHVSQPAIAKIEQKTDAYLSTIRSPIEAMGGNLEFIARFLDGAVKISNFSSIDSLILDSHARGTAGETRAGIIDLPDIVSVIARQSVGSDGGAETAGPYSVAFQGSLPSAEIWQAARASGISIKQLSEW